MKSILIKSATIINEGKAYVSDLLIKNGRIEKIGTSIGEQADLEINAEGKFLIPGCIDDQVHFREPGLTHKASIGSEARAAVAGGITSFMEMPNTKPPALSQELLEQKYAIAEKNSPANYSFYMGVSNDNLEEVLKTDPENVCGIKIFMGSSTGNMLVDDEYTLRNIFSQTPMLIAVHCEDEKTVKINEDNARFKYGDKVPIALHPEIRSADACYKSSSFAASLAKQYRSRLHILHLSTEIELGLFDPNPALMDKRVTSEVCVHHLWFDRDDYANLGTKIKCNPAIKSPSDRKALLKGLLSNHIDVIATDHAPHTKNEKQNNYFNAPSGIPLVQHALNMMLEFYHQGFITLEKLVEKMCHAPADCFRVLNRGYIREGYWADIVLLDLDRNWKVRKDNILYQCGWSPLEGKEFGSAITHTIVNGNLVFENLNGEMKFSEGNGMRLKFAKER